MTRARRKSGSDITCVASVNIGTARIAATSEERRGNLAHLETSPDEAGHAHGRQRGKECVRQLEEHDVRGKAGRDQPEQRERAG